MRKRNGFCGYSLRILTWLVVVGSVSLQPVWGQLPVSDGVVLWLDATDLGTLFQDSAMTTPAVNNGPVGGWKDKSGNDFHATQTIPDQRPSRNDTAMNGSAAVRFAGANASGMAISEDLILERPYTAFIVNQYYGDFFGRTLQGLDSNWLHGLWSGRPASYADGFVSINRAARVNFPYVEDTTGDLGGGSTFFVNGIDRTATSTPSGAPGRLGLGSVGLFPAEVSDADVSEIVIYDRVLEGAELTVMRDYLYTKYNVEILPPDGGLNPSNTVLHGSVGAFTGADVGEGLDLAGNFVYAVDVGGFGDYQVGDATFTDGSELGMENGSSEGVSITDANEILAWHAPDYGDSADDDQLESVMQSIRWNTPPGLEVTLDVDPGKYQLQLLFAEQCCDRGFDIFVEDQMAVDNFNVQVLQGGIGNSTAGAYFAGEYSVTDGVLTVNLVSDNPLAGDNNPILNGVTLEYLGPAAAPGDFNADGVLDATDIDLLSTAVRAGNNPAGFDLNGDASVTDADRTVWVEDLKRTYFGDSNLDGEFNSTDLVVVFQIGEYEDQTPSNSTWADGDWSGDGDFDSADFVVAFQAGGYEQGPRAAVAGVPEPASSLLLWMGLSALASWHRRRS